MESREVVIVGAGPIGLEVAWALGRAGVGALVIEAGCIGATMDWWAPGTSYFSSPERIQIAGIPLVTPNQGKATREEYLAYLRQVVGAHGLEVRAFTRVIGIEREADGGFVLSTRPSDHGVGGPAEQIAQDHSGAPVSRVRARRVVLAIGDMHRPRRLGIEGEDLPGVSHYLGDPHHASGQRVLIVGGKNSAVEAAIRLYRVGAEVTISYRREAFDRDRVKYWLLPEIDWLISKEKIGFLPGTTPCSIRLARGRHPLAVEFDTGATHAADRVLLLTGYDQDPTLLEMAGVRLKDEPERAPILNRRTQEAVGAPGVYVAGTATAGSQQRARVFIENCHVHAERIAAAVRGAESPAADVELELEES